MWETVVTVDTASPPCVSGRVSGVAGISLSRYDTQLAELRRIIVTEESIFAKASYEISKKY